MTEGKFIFCSRLNGLVDYRVWFDDDDDEKKNVNNNTSPNVVSVTVTIRITITWQISVKMFCLKINTWKTTKNLLFNCLPGSSTGGILIGSETTGGGGKKILVVLLFEQ